VLDTIAATVYQLQDKPGIGPLLMVVNRLLTGIHVAPSSTSVLQLSASSSPLTTGLRPADFSFPTFIRERIKQELG
jgi:hypothetical protein